MEREETGRTAGWARLGVLTAARVALLGGATALAFFSGGYFDAARAGAGLGAWILVALALLAGRPLPRGRPAWLALGGLALLAGWTLSSITWAPIAGSAYHAAQIDILYLGALLAAAMLLRGRGSARAVEPALAAGALLVVGYGLSERLLPGLLHFARSFSAQGRLEQPLTYWNAMGELAAIGLVLCARLAGDATRSAKLRAVAAGAAAPLGMGLYISFSRGALFAFAAGLVALVTIAHSREQLRGALVTLVAGALAATAAAPFHAVTALAGTKSTRDGQGAAALGLLVVIVVAAVTAQTLIARRERPGALRLPRRAPVIALALICAGLALAIVVGAKERSARPIGASATRFATLQSNRYAYWDVALRAFSAEPIRGVGAGGWAVWWLRYRTVNEFAQDAHSLPLQTMAELGLIGLALLGALIAGIAWAARAAQRASPVLLAGPAAALVTYIAHSPLDWDWQMPALTLVAVVLGGAVLAIAELEPARTPAEPEAAPLPATAQVA